MTHLSQSIIRSIKTMVVMPLLVFSGFVLSNPLAPMVDNFNNTTKNSLGIERMFITDQSTGGGSTNDVQIIDGVMQVKGELLPSRGQPAWSSSVLLLGAQNTAQDASAYQGVRMLIRVRKGNVSLSANSTKVTNFDYHTANLVIPSDGQFHQLDIPFNTMKPMWSEQAQLDPATLASLSIVAFSLQPSTYDFEVDQISFY